MTAVAGAGLRTVSAPLALAARNAAAVTSCGISNCPTTTVGRMAATASSARSTGTWRFAPGTMMIRFMPAPSTQIGATPEEPGTRRTYVVSTPCATRLAIVSPPYPSSPTVLTIATRAPRRAAATAWFAPLPPKPDRNPVPTRVSPASGRRSA